MAGRATRFRDLPIRRKLTALLLLSSAAGLVLAGAILIGYDWFTARADTVKNLETLARVTADNSTAALAFRDADTATQTLGALKARPEVIAGCLYAPHASGLDTLFAAYAPNPSSPCPAEPGAAGTFEKVDVLTVVVPVEESGDRIGWLLLRETLAPLQQALLVQVAITLTILGGAFLVTIAAGRLLQRTLVEPVLQLAEVARKVSESKDYSARAEATSADEVGRLAADFNQMLEQIGERDEELNRLNDSLGDQVKETRLALAQLREAQTQLIQSEKLASLGSLVAGVAHEINTPVGIGVTAASTLADRAGTLQRLYAEQKMKRSDLERFIGVSQESTQIILKNLQRAADLIHSFKQVAVDQSSGDRRRFGLKAYLDEVLLSLAPALKKTPHEVTVSCPGDLTIDSFPGALAQVVTNLVNNSLIHAFEGKDHGTMHLEVRQADDWVTLEYRDNGRGIPKEHQQKIFDPFFTTRRGSGGSGLGMHIVYNLVTQVLGGTIDVGDAPGGGARFRIGFPVVARKAAA